MSDLEAVLQANREFYRAFESLDADQMAECWLQDPRITCIHPGWRRLSGWGPIMESWERIFQSVFEMKFELGETSVIMGGEMAIVVVEENLTQRGYDGTMKTQVMATNVFERIGHKWRLVLHHGSPVMAPADDQPPIQ